MVRLYEFDDGTRPPKKIIRRCEWEGCRTILADANKNPYCFVHLYKGIEKDLFDRKRPIHSSANPSWASRRGKKKVRV